MQNNIFSTDNQSFSYLFFCTDEFFQFNIILYTEIFQFFQIFRPQTGQRQSACAAVKADFLHGSFYWDGIDFGEQGFNQRLQTNLQIRGGIKISIQCSFGHSHSFFWIYIGQDRYDSIATVGYNGHNLIVISRPNSDTVRVGKIRK